MRRIVWYMVAVSCGDVNTVSRSTGVDTVHAQVWSVVKRKQTFFELEAATKFARPFAPSSRMRGDSAVDNAHERATRASRVCAHVRG